MKDPARRSTRARRHRVRTLRCEFVPRRRGDWRPRWREPEAWETVGAAQQPGMGSCARPREEENREVLVSDLQGSFWLSSGAPCPTELLCTEVVSSLHFSSYFFIPHSAGVTRAERAGSVIAIYSYTAREAPASGRPRGARAAVPVRPISLWLS